MHCNLVNNSFQQASKVLFTFVPNKQFRQLITISPHLLTMLKTTNEEFQSVQLWFTDQNNRPLEIEDSVNVTLIIGQALSKRDIQQNQSTENTLKDTVFCHLQKDLVINMVKD